MMRIADADKGMSLVEATIILMVMMLLTSVLAPSINDYVNDAKHVKAKEDCEAIGQSVARLARDVGPCMKWNGGQPCTKQNRVDILFSDGKVVSSDDLGPQAVDFQSNEIKDNVINWGCRTTQNADHLENQLVRNSRGYATPADKNTFGKSGPHWNLGWRGAYISPVISADPWGNRYLVNTVFLTVAIDANHGRGEGQRSGGWSKDTICITGGPNNLYESPFAGSQNGGTERLGDDLIFVISGDSR